MLLVSVFWPINVKRIETSGDAVMLTVAAIAAVLFI